MLEKLRKELEEKELELAECKNNEDDILVECLEEEVDLKKQSYLSYREFCYPNNSIRHSKFSSALNEVMCQPVDFPGTKIFKWCCVLDNCANCPRLKRHDFETVVDNDKSKMVRFEHYVKRHRCSNHGLLVKDNLEEEAGEIVCIKCHVEGVKNKISSKKERTFGKLPIGLFMEEQYLPLLEKYEFHYPHVKLLSGKHAKKERMDAFADNKHSVVMERDYAEAFKTTMNWEIHGDHFGWNPTISVEGSTASFHSTDLPTVQKHHFTHFSDNAGQHASTTYENMHKELETLRDMGVLQCRKSTVFGHTDGCGGQYRSALSCFLNTVLSSSFGVPIDRMVHAPAHGKGEVDGLNAVTKRYLYSCMRDAAKADTKNLEGRFQPWLHSENGQLSFAEEAVRLCSNPKQKDGVKWVGKKNLKRVTNKKVHKRHYHSISKEEVRYRNLKMRTLEMPSSKRKVNGKTAKHGGTRARYNFRSDPDLGVGWIACRRIPCACASCVSQLKKEWVPSKSREDQPRYAQNKDCEKWDVFQGENDWEIVEIKYQRKGDGSNDQDIEDMQVLTSDIILDDLEVCMARDASAGFYGAHPIAMDTETDFEVFQFLTDPYQFKKEQCTMPSDEVKEVQEGELVAKAIVLGKLGISGEAKNWYMPQPERQEIIVRFRQVINCNLKLLPISEDNHLPRPYPQGVPPLVNSGRSRRSEDQLSRMGKGCKMTQQVREEILAEIERREALDYEFEVCDDLEIPQTQMDMDEEDAFYGNEEEQEEQAFI